MFGIDWKNSCVYNHVLDLHLTSSTTTSNILDSSIGIEELQLKQLSRTLDSSNNCSEQTQANGNDYLHQMLLKHGVDAYLSGQSCDNEARIGGPYLTTINQESYPPKEMVNMFLLNRVNPLEITTYGVGFKGVIVHESTVRQRGRDTM